MDEFPKTSRVLKREMEDGVVMITRGKGDTIAEFQPGIFNEKINEN